MTLTTRYAARLKIVLMALAVCCVWGCHRAQRTEGVDADTSTASVLGDSGDCCVETSSVLFESETGSGDSDTLSRLDTSLDTGTDRSAHQCIDNWEILYVSDADEYMYFDFMSPYSDNDVIAFSRDEWVVIHNAGEVVRTPHATELFLEWLSATAWLKDTLYIVTADGQLYSFKNGQWRYLYHRSDVERAAPFNENPEGIMHCATANSLALSGKTLFASGDCWREHEGSPLWDGSIMRLDDNKWQREEGLPPVSRETRLFELENDAIVAMTSNDELLIFDGSQWYVPPFQVPDYGRDVWGISEADFWVAGEVVYHVADGVVQQVPMSGDAVDTDAVAPDSLIYYGAESVCGTPEGSVFIQGMVWYTEWRDPNFFDVEERFVEYYDGTGFVSILSGYSSINQYSDCMAFENDAAIFSPQLYYSNGAFEEMDPWFTGRLAGNAPDDIYTFKTYGHASGMHFNGDAWTQVNITPSVRDLTLAKDGSVYALDTTGAIVHWTPPAAPPQNATQAKASAAIIRPPNCQKIVDIAVSEGGKMAVACRSGTILHFEGNGWQRIPPTIYRALSELCYAGETLTWLEYYPFKDTENMPHLIRQLANGEVSSYETSARLDHIACSSNGAMMMDDEGALHFFDGKQSVLLSAVPKGEGKITQFVANAKTVYVVVDSDAEQQLWVYSDNEWSKNHLPIDPTMMALSPGGRLFIGHRDGVVARWGCDE
ncbi:MAG: hypothetical protein JXR76_13035 [Deltaproteobacteria bacterium]|nr:hypothetical protein [Deltaproteobacteria bacterium]